MKTITAQRSGKLISFLREELSLSARATQKLMKSKEVTVNGEVATAYQHILCNDVITLHELEQDHNILPENGVLRILYEDDKLLFIDKPSGITMHPTKARIEGTVANYVAGYYLQQHIQAGIHMVNRLDRDTFGVVIVAKDAITHAKIMQQMQEHQVVKTYRAWVYGHPKVKEGTIALPIALVEGNPILRRIHSSGQAAQTDFKVLRETEKGSLVSLLAITGRTHQLRLHCVALGCPIVGDEQYGTPESIAFSRSRGRTTQQLQSYSLALVHPFTGKEMAVLSQQELREI